MVDVSDESIELPPGFRFHPTDEEIITHYLSEKVLNSSFTARAVSEADLNKCEPWDLPKKARMGEKEWYFFCQRDRKYPTGMRTNRATEAGYWKATGKDKEIYKGRNCLVGMKKTLVFYRGRAPKGEKTNWVMHEYRLEGKFSYHNLPRTAKDEWVVCRVFHKSTGVKKSPMVSMRMDSFGGGDDIFDSPPSLPLLMDSSPYFINSSRPSSSFMDNNANDNKFTGNQLTYSTNIPGENVTNHQHHLQSNNYPMITNTNSTPNTNYYSQIQYPNMNPVFAFQGSSNSGYFQPNNPGFGSDQQAINKSMAANIAKCKVEQFSSNQSMVSQETGLSTDMTTEISSVASRGNRPYDDFEGPSSSSPGPVVDLESLWNY